MARSLFARLTRRYGTQPDRPTRRQMLQDALAASAGLLLSGLGCRRPVPSANQERRVLIVGGGFAGLACGHELRAAGYTVTLLEARPWLGGRVVSLHDLVPGKTVEGGGEFIGTNHPTWLAYARHFGLTLTEPDKEEAHVPVVLDGRRLDDKEAGQLYKEMEQVKAALIPAAQPINADEPWKSPDATRLDRRSVADALAGLEIGPLGKRGLAAEFTGNMGIEPARMSYLLILSVVKGHGLEKYWTDTETQRCRGGNQQLADRLAEGLGAENLRLGLAVTHINITEGKARVRTADEKWHEADDVVLAVPPSVWPALVFDPPLPETLRVQMGSNVKYLAAVKSRFWADRPPDSLCDDDLGMTWEATAGQAGPEGAALASFAGGEVAQACRRLGTAERRAAYRRRFESLLPGFTEQFVKDAWMDWPGDPWTKCGYCAPAPGQVTVYGPVVRRGLGRLHFVGEHTSFAFMGFMEGGLSSGVALARRLAARDGVAQ